MLRLDAEKFGDGRVRRGDARRPNARASPPARLVWPRASLIADRRSCTSIPSPQAGPVPRARRPDRGRPGRPRLRGARDRRGGRRSRGYATTASGFRRFLARTRGRCSTRSAPRSSTRPRSAAPCSGCCWSAGVDPTLGEPHPGDHLRAHDAARGARPGPLPAGPDARDGPHRRLADDRRPAASARRSSATPSPASRSSCATGHTGQTDAARSRGRGDREATAPARGLAGDRVAGVRLVGIADGGPRRRPVTRRAGPSWHPVAAAAGRALRPRPVLRLALPVLRLRRLRRCRGARPAGARSTAFVAALGGRAGAAGRRARCGLRRAAGRRSRRSTSAAGRRRSCRPTRSPRCSPGFATATASPPAPRSRSRPIPGPTNAAMPERSGAAGVTRLSLGAQAVDGGPAPARPAPSRRSTSCGRRGRPGRPASAPSASTCCTTCPASTLADWIDDARRGPRARARPPVALRADARRSRRRGPDRPRRRPPADDAPAPDAGAHRRDRHRTRIARRPSTTTPSTGWPTTAGTATRSATGPARATRAATTSSTGSGGRTRRSVRARTPSTAVTRRWNAARLDGYLAALTPADGSDAALPPGRSERSIASHGGRRDGDPRAADGPRSAARGRPRAAARRRRSAGRWPPSCSTRRRDDRVRPDDARPAALERAVRRLV